MKLNAPLTYGAIIYNVINVLFWIQISHMQSANSTIFIIFYPLFWIITISAIVIITKNKSSIWFQKKYLMSTVVALLFCTPIPFLITISLNFSDTYVFSTGSDSKNGYTFKSETVLYRSTNSLQVVKYWKVHLPKCSMCDTSLFKRDSTWIYFDKKRDTIKIEVYKNGKLLFQKNKFNGRPRITNDQR